MNNLAEFMGRPLPLAAAALVQAAAVVFVTAHVDARLAAAVVAAPAIAVTVPAALAQAGSKIRALFRDLHWWHGAWLLLWLSGQVFRVRDAREAAEAPLDFWAGYRIALVGMAAFLLVMRLVSRATPWIGWLTRGPVGALALLTALGVVSTLWSVYPGWTLYKSAEYFIDLALFAAVLAHAWTVRVFKRLFDWAWTMTALLLATVWAGAAISPGTAWIPSAGPLGMQLQGVLPDISANGVGDLSATLIIVAVSRIVQAGRSGRTLVYFLLLAASIPTLVLAQTRSALVGCAAGVGLVVLLARRFRLFAALTLIALFAISLTSVPAEVQAYIVRGQNPELFTSLSGRTGWWTAALDSLAEKPGTGYGAFAGGRFVALASAGNTQASSLHNAYLEVAIGTGVPGLALLLLAVAGTWWSLLRRTPAWSRGTFEFRLGVEAAGVLALLMVRSVFTSNLIWHPPMDFLMIVAFAEFLRRRQMSSVPT